MISNLDSHHEAWSSTLSDLKICPSEDVKLTIHRLENIAGFLNQGKGAETLLAEDVVLQGLNIFIKNALTVRVLPAVEKIVVGVKNGRTDNVESEDEDLKVLLEAFFAVVTNFTSHDSSAESFLKCEGMIQDLKPLWLDRKYSRIFPLSVKSLHNLSTGERKRELLLEKYPGVMRDCIRLINSLSHSPEQLESYVVFIANMTTSREARRLLLDPNDYEMYEDIFKLLQPAQPAALRRAGSRIIKHLTADAVCHSYLLGETVNILPAILLPLAGNEKFDDEDYATMPVELQYLDQSKTRDEDVEVRENLLAAILQLCRLRCCRVKIRDANAYYILRELHKFETEETMIDLVERVVDLLIRKEEEIGEKGDFVDFPVPPLEQWINGEWKYSEDAEMK